MKEEDGALATGQELDSRVSPEVGGNSGLKPGGFWVRFLAVILDGLIIMLVTLPSSFILETLLSKKIGINKMDIMLYQFIFSNIVSFCYFGWFYRNKGATPGKMIMGIRVIYLSTGENLTYIQTLLREPIGKTFSGVIFMIGYIMAGVRKDKRALHDLIAGTQVVEK